MNATYFEVYSLDISTIELSYETKISDNHLYLA